MICSRSLGGPRSRGHDQDIGRHFLLLYRSHRPPDADSLGSKAGKLVVVDVPSCEAAQTSRNAQERLTGFPVRLLVRPRTVLTGATF